MKGRQLTPLAVLALGICSVVALRSIGKNARKAKIPATRPNLEYLKKVNLSQPPEDPQLLFLLMGEYANANKPLKIRFYARSNYREELDRELNAPGNFGRHFFGERYNPDDVRNFKPDVTINRATQVNIGGTRFELIPVEGGETADGMFIEVPGLSVLFVGDFIMPYLGAPFVEEGNFQGLLDAIDIVVEKNPRHLLHGHEPITRNFGPAPVLAALKTYLVWLREQVLTAIRRGEENASVQQANLIPPGLLTGLSGAILPYLIMREHVIDRLFDQNVGYWQTDLQGISHISHADRAEMLVDYLGISESQLAHALTTMIADGKYELAASLLESTGGRFSKSRSIAKVERLIYRKLMEQNQNTDPFKFLLYSAKAGDQIPEIEAASVK